MHASSSILLIAVGGNVEKDRERGGRHQSSTKTKHILEKDKKVPNTFQTILQGRDGEAVGPEGEDQVETDQTQDEQIKHKTNCSNFLGKR